MKKAAIELSIGTIVIIVLAMAMLILGIVLVRNIFSGSTEAVDNINQGVINEINELFTDSNKRMAVYPSTRKITIPQGTDGRGFAFSVRNNDIDEKTFTYNVAVDPNFNIQKKCKIGVQEAEDWIVVPSGTITLAPGQKMDNPILVVFNIPESAPPCTLPFIAEVRLDGAYYDGVTVYLTIEPEK